MWKAVLVGSHDTCLIAPLCVKHQVTDCVYLLSSWTDGKFFYHTDAHVLQGKNINGFIKDFRKSKGIKKFEGSGNYFISLTRRKKQLSYWDFLWDKRIIHSKPVIQKTDGTEEWEISSWKKEILMAFIRKMEGFSLKSIKQENLRNIFLPNISPNLSARQQEVFDLATKEGYYKVPKQITLDQMAKIMKVSKPTLQEHLRKAESKLIPLR